jgi:hypothetical protein
MVEQMEENKKLDVKSDCLATDTTLDFFNSQHTVSPLDLRCMVCNSGFINEIHQMRSSLSLRELSEKIKEEYGFNFSKDVLARHFQHYTRALNVESTKMLLAKFDRDAENVSEHQKKVLFLCKISFDHIVERLESGTLELGMEDFEKMIKLYYSVLRDPDSVGDGNIINIFQRASEKYGCGLEQGVLIKKKPPAGVGGE